MGSGGPESLEGTVHRRGQGRVAAVDGAAGVGEGCPQAPMRHYAARLGAVVLPGAAVVVSLGGEPPMCFFWFRLRDIPFSSIILFSLTLAFVSLKDDVLLALLLLLLVS